MLNTNPKDCPGLWNIEIGMKNVHFTDESRFGRHSDSPRVSVSTNSLIPRNCQPIQEIHSSRGGSVSVGGGICFNERIDLLVLVLNWNMTNAIYIEEVINNVIRNLYAITCQDFLFLDDNATPHRSAILLEALENQGIPYLPLPPRSPKLHCIEHAWNQLQRSLSAHVTTF